MDELIALLSAYHVVPPDQLEAVRIYSTGKPGVSGLAAYLALHPAGLVMISRPEIAYSGRLLATVTLTLGVVHKTEAGAHTISAAVTSLMIGPPFARRWTATERDESVTPEGTSISLTFTHVTTGGSQWT